MELSRPLVPSSISSRRSRLNIDRPADSLLIAPEGMEDLMLPSQQAILKIIFKSALILLINTGEAITSRPPFLLEIQ